MGTIPHAWHRSARPISVYEFMDAVQATCPPRFPHARGVVHRKVALAVSGGVDSMALAFLCSQVRRANPLFKISDSPCGGFAAFIVDHRLREGSGAEAHAVRAAVFKLDIPAQVVPLRWSHVIPRGVDPTTLTNVESLARRLRYRGLGSGVAWRNLMSLLVAHHEDDQYETVLMRLMAGHGVRGLRGIRRANDIPECFGMHGIHQSGFVDDQKQETPVYNMRPSRRQKKYIRGELLEDIDPDVFAKELAMGAGDTDLFNPGNDADMPRKSSKKVPRLSPLDIEDSGIMIYRPLLEFSKDRLIATCVENGVPWFEDHTNKDATLTPRNAVRHLYQNHELPVALQKPAVLQLAARCRRRTELEEAEADRLIRSCIIKKFDPNAGTVLIQLPEVEVHIRRQGSMYSSAWQSGRLEHMRTVAALLVQKALGLVTPEHHVTGIGNLLTAVTALFPGLADGKESSSLPPKAFTTCGVFFVPVHAEGDGRLSWYLSRTPYPSPASTPLPSLYTDPVSPKIVNRGPPGRWKWPEWWSWQMYDGRFWIRLCNRLTTGVVVMPFAKEFAKPFREAQLNDTARDELAALLKKHAPGKVRYTLPALYAIGDVDWALKGSEGQTAALEGEAGNKPTRRQHMMGYDDGLRNTQHRYWYDRRGEGYLPNMTLLALPTLGVHVPGIEHWLQWEVRYRKVDRRMLDLDDEARDSGPWIRPPQRHRRWIVFGRWSRRRGRASVQPAT